MSENRNQESRKSNRGFAAMDRERQREIARQGGRAAHQQGVAHRWTSEEAREAGRKGGERSRSGRRAPENNNDGENIL
jgi:general stress protein YciG